MTRASASENNDPMPTPVCLVCAAQMPGHHADACTFWGTILPSECQPEFTAWVIRHVLRRQTNR